MVFRRRRAAGADELQATVPVGGPAEDARPDPGPQRAAAGSEESGGQDNGAAGRGQGSGAHGRGGAQGPWDVTDAYPERERIDLGSLRIPAVPGLDVQVNFAGDKALAVIVVRGDSMLQLQAFAAPKRAGLWDDIRHELMDELTAAGGHGDEAPGPFGVEVRARVPAEAGGARSLQSARFLGADGPRWFLRGVISGPAAAHPSHAKALEDVFGGTVVVRGEHPAPPRDLLEVRLPAEAQQALEEQMAAAAESGEPVNRFERGEPLNPFERGPEITETR